MAPGASKEAHFEHFGALAAKWAQEAPRRLILSILVPWPPNGPRSAPGGQETSHKPQTTRNIPHKPQATS